MRFKARLGWPTSVNPDIMNAALASLGKIPGDRVDAFWRTVDEYRLGKFERELLADAADIDIEGAA